MAFFDGAGAGLISGIGGLITNRENRQLAEGQMDFQQRMSSNAHQREVKDLRAAGLNPILSAKYGGSSTPPGALAQMENFIGQGVSSAQQAREVSSGVGLKNAQSALAQASVAATKAAAERDISTAKQANAVTRQTMMLDKAVAAEAKKREIDAKIDEKTAVPRKTLDLIRQGTGAVQDLRPGIQIRGPQNQRPAPYEQKHDGIFNQPKGN